MNAVSQDIPDDDEEVLEYVGKALEYVVEKLWHDCDAEHIERFFIAQVSHVNIVDQGFVATLSAEDQRAAAEAVQAGVRGRAARIDVKQLRERNSLFNRAYAVDETSRKKVTAHPRTAQQQLGGPIASILT